MSSEGESGDILDGVERLVVKIGSSLFIDSETGALDQDWLKALCDDVAALCRRGLKIVVVSSGAVALGRRELSIDPRRSRLEDAQAAAAAGQILLAHAYQEYLREHSLTTAQVLLTLDDSENRRRYLNASMTLINLLNRGAIPVVNENDTVATQELRYGDNDRLAARVAQMVSADCLIVLSDVDGLYTADPLQVSTAEHIPLVTDLVPAHWEMAGGPTSPDGSGGMRTKLDAARISIGAGCKMVITSGHVLHPLRALLDGARATWFMPSASPKAARKQWIAGTLQPKGVLRVDAGAAKALATGRSLLPAGVTLVSGSFERGDAVRVEDPEGRELGRGLVAYSAAEAQMIAGHRTQQIEGILGYRGRSEIIHRDDLVLSHKSEQI